MYAKISRILIIVAVVSVSSTLLQPPLELLTPEAASGI